MVISIKSNSRYLGLGLLGLGLLGLGLLGLGLLIPEGSCPAEGKKRK